MPRVYPGATVRVYIDEQHYAIQNIKERWPWVEVVVKPNAAGSSGMFWRLEAACDKSYSHAIVRDVDSRVSEREADLVRDWIRSGLDLHCIREAPQHLLTPVLGGAHGYRTAAFPNMRLLLDGWKHSNQYGDDELFLKTAIFDVMPRDRTLGHTSVGGEWGDEVAIPKADNGKFVCMPETPDFRNHLKKLYVINAPHYKNRYRKFCEAIQTSSILRELEIVRVEGCYECDEPVPHWWDQSHKHWWLVTQDHKALLKKLVIERTDLALIFEDDGLPNQYFDEYFQRAWDCADGNKMLGHTHKPWEALMLGGQQDNKRQQVSEQLKDDLAIATGGYGQHSILYNYSGLRHFWAHATYWNHEAIDVAFAGFQRQFESVYCPAKWITDIVGIQWGYDN
jgi:hypothetical protein